MIANNEKMLEGIEGFLSETPEHKLDEDSHTEGNQYNHVDQLAEIIACINLNKVNGIAERDYLEKLNTLFLDGYQRRYSDSYTILNDLQLDKKEDFEALIDKLKILYKSCANSDLERKDEVCRLLDYFSLECYRFHNHIDEKKQIGQIESLNNDAVHLKQEYQSFQDKSITVFSIFSAVIITFSGGFGLASGVLSEMQCASPNRLVFITSLLGIILFDVVFGMLYIVSKLVGKDIGMRCRYSGLAPSSCRHGGEEKQCQSFGCKLCHRYTYVLLFNVFLILLMAISAYNGFSF